MSTRSILGLMYTLEGVEGMGLDTKPFLKRYGIDIQSLSPDAEIDRMLELRIFNEVFANLEDPLAGIKIGAAMSLAGYGPFIMMLMTCENAWEAFRAGIQYQQLTYLYGELSLLPEQDRISLRLQPTLLPSSCYRVLLDRDMSGTYQLVLDLQNTIGSTIQPLEVHMPYAKPKDIKPYEKRYGCPVLFDMPDARFVIPSKATAIRFPSANRTAHALYRKQCDQVLTARAQKEQSDKGISEQVVSLLELFVNAYPSIEDVARNFDMSERSLRRKLSEQGTSFRKLLDQVRAAKATEMLQDTQLSIDAIAHQLGYTESAAFIHAFQRWTNTTPAAFRNKNRQGT